MVTWHKLPDQIKLADHHTRHENGGADEISLTGLESLFGLIGHIDGGDLGDSVDSCVPAIIRDAYDAMTGAMSSLFTNLDGGTF